MPPDRQVGDEVAAAVSRALRTESGRCGDHAAAFVSAVRWQRARADPSTARASRQREKSNSAQSVRQARTSSAGSPYCLMTVAGSNMLDQIDPVYHH